jgi:ribosomal protein S18 acetylase RimI-like enzyme
MAEHRLQVEDRPDEEDIRFLRQTLVKYNLAHSSIGDTQELAVFVRSEENRIVAGVSGHTWGECLEIQYLWVHADLRGQGYGRRLLLEIERQAAARGCRQAILDTYSFQAPGFYRELGYEVWGEIDGFPNGYRKFFLKKRL